jgi:hypothetical protein
MQMNIWSTKMLQKRWNMRGSNSKMLQIPLKWEFPVPKLCKEKGKATEQQIQKNTQTEKSNSPPIPDPYNRLVNLDLRILQTLRILINNLKLMASQLGMWIMWSDTHHATGESFKNRAVQDPLTDCSVLMFSFSDMAGMVAWLVGRSV